MKTEEEKLKRKLKVNTIAIVVLLVILLVVLCVVLVRVFQVKDGANNNDGNLGLAAQSEDFIFYYDYNKGLVRKDKKEEKILTEDQAYSINYYDGAIFYTTPSSNGGINIKKINADGKGSEILLTVTSSSTKMYLEDGKIYYLTSNPDTISRVDVDGKNEVQLLQRSIVDFKVVNGTIYFSDIMGFLYSVDTEGENYKTLCKESKFSKFQILDKWVYYFDIESEKLVKVNLEDVSKKEEVTDKLDCDTYNVTSSGIYYLDKANGKIKVVSLNGKKDNDVVAVNTDNTKINVAGTALYYIDASDGKTITKVIGVNGKEIK